MKNKVAKERTIYDNYDLEKIFPDNVLIETAKGEKARANLCVLQWMHNK